MNDRMFNKIDFFLIKENDWPPVGVEEVHCTNSMNGIRIESPPLFIKDLSVGDVITVFYNESGQVTHWTTQIRSGNTTVWLLRMTEEHNIPHVISELHKIGCNTVSLVDFGCYSINIPSDIEFDRVDACLSLLNQNQVAIAFPSFRHEEQ